MSSDDALRPSAARLRGLADTLDAEGDDALATAARRAADDLDAQTSDASGRPEAPPDEPRR